MKKNQFPISVSGIYFSVDTRVCNDDNALNEDDFLSLGHDFVLSPDSRGLAVQLVVFNNNIPKGVRRQLSLTVIDQTERCELASRIIKVNLSGKDICKYCYAAFPADTIALKGGHTYRCVVRDVRTSEIMAENVMHLYSCEQLGHPSGWYAVDGAGVRPAWTDNLYKSIAVDDSHDYYIRFNLHTEFGSNMPSILPELEMRLFAPDGNLIDCSYAEPAWSDADGMNYYVEFPLRGARKLSGAFYAKLLCMESPIAGFVFGRGQNTVAGEWFGPELQPLDCCSAKAMADRLSELLPEALEPALPDVEEIDFDAALNDFIGSGESEVEDAEDAEDSADAESADDAEVAEPVGTGNIFGALDNLTGLRDVKAKLVAYERVVRFNKMRADRGLPTSATPLHAMFLGSPGTGKTTVAKLLGHMLRRAGLLSKGHVVVRERATLLGQNYNSESEKTMAAIEEAQGGILLIDEAYQLYQSNDARDPGKFVIDTLLTALADESNRDWMLVLAGYPDEMMNLFNINPGFKSRIPDSNIYRFEDFTASELMEIADNYLKRLRYTLSDDARKALSGRLDADYACRTKNFGNARHVINMIQTEVLPAMALRVTDCGEADDRSLTEIQASDIPVASGPLKVWRQSVGFAI